MTKTVKLSRTSESPPDKLLPKFVVPMAAAYVKEPFDSPDWVFETKLDCYCAIAVIDSAGKARLWSRNHLPLEPKLPTIGCALNQLNLRSTILDGEIVAFGWRRDTSEGSNSVADYHCVQSRIGYRFSPGIANVARDRVDA
jgi:ATP-dependent DNA ligase